MQGCRRSRLLVGAVFVLIAGGCATSGREQAFKGSGPSPTFGQNYVPQQREPVAESVADGATPASRKAASKKSEPQSVVTANFDEPADDPSGSKGNKLINWMASRDKEAPRKPLPLSSSANVANDDEQ